MTFTVATNIRYGSIKRNIQPRESTYYYNAVIRIHDRLARRATFLTARFGIPRHESLFDSRREIKSAPLIAIVLFVFPLIALSLY